MDRPLLPIATFEHMQSANWVGGRPVVSNFDICDGAMEIHADLQERAKAGRVSLSEKFISEVHGKFSSRLENCEQAMFRNSGEWLEFVGEIEKAADPDPVTVFNSGAWILSQLYWQHLNCLRLVTSWLIVDALALQEGSPRLQIRDRKLGRLLEDISASGPPLFDAENARGQLHKYA